MYKVYRRTDRQADGGLTKSDKKGSLGFQQIELKKDCYITLAVHSL